jgi:magnesium transporter
MAEHSVTVENTLQTLLSDKKYSTIRDILVTMNPADIAAVFAGVEQEKLPLLFRLLPKELAAESFVEMESEEQEALIRGISDKELRQVMDELYVDDAVDIVEEMPANVVQRILAQADPEMRKEINEILQYPENSAGSVMTTEYVKLSPGMTVGDAILRIRRTGVDKETIYTCYVLDNRLLVGTVSVKSLLLAPSDLQTIDSIMETNLITVTTHTDQEEVARMMSKYNLLAIPVVDRDNRMVGIVTFDDAMDVMEDEATEDIEIMAGMTPSDKTYLRSSPFDLFKHRIPWLSLLMISATFTGLIISGFEDRLAALVCLTAFIPMLMDTGGNSGSQSSVTVIRALSLGELEFADLPKVIWKEFRTALICGGVLALLCFGKVMLIDHLLLKTDGVDFMVALVIAMTMAVTVVCAKMVGCTLPMLAKKLGFDPAVMASPFITTIVDALSLLVYFGIASALLPALREAAAAPEAAGVVKQVTDHLAMIARSIR